MFQNKGPYARESWFVVSFEKMEKPGTELMSQSFTYSSKWRNHNAAGILLRNVRNLIRNIIHLYEIVNASYISKILTEIKVPISTELLEFFS